LICGAQGALTQWQLAIAHALNQLSPGAAPIGASLRAMLRPTLCRESSAYYGKRVLQRCKSGSRCGDRVRPPRAEAHCKSYLAGEREQTFVNPKVTGWLACYGITTPSTVRHATCSPSAVLAGPRGSDKLMTKSGICLRAQRRQPSAVSRLQPLSYVAVSQVRVVVRTFPPSPILRHCCVRSLLRCGAGLCHCGLSTSS
jgi:hypothetical protein